jgi:epoxide hydrolase 4
MTSAPPMHTFDAILAHGFSLSCRSNRAWQHGTPPASDAPTKRAPRVMFLHGFPEAAFVWDEVIAQLGDAVHAIAPNLRGYERSSAPQDVASYHARLLAQDVARLINVWNDGEPLDLLVAHDWGGAVAWALACRTDAHERPFKRLLIINAPHPAPFLRDLQHNAAQQQASEYMNFLCRSDSASHLAANDHERLFAFFTQMNGAPWLNEAMKAKYRQVWRHGLEGPLNYYRASPLRPPTGPDSPIHKVNFKVSDVTVRVPTFVLWGEADVALPPTLLDGLESYVPNMQVQRVPGASHWIVHEKPSLVVQAVRDALLMPV